MAEAPPETPAVQFFGRVYPVGLKINAKAPGIGLMTARSRG
jgi:hypothetical protein